MTTLDRQERETLLQKLIDTYHEFLPYHKEIEMLRENTPDAAPGISAKKMWLWGAAGIFVSGHKGWHRWLGIGVTIMFFVSIFTGNVLYWLITGALAALHIYIRVRRNRINKENNQKIDTIIAALKARLHAWPECPVIWHEYTHPLWLDGIYRRIENGRADTVQAAINLLIGDRQHQENMEAQARVIAGQKKSGHEIIWSTVFTIGAIAMLSDR